MTTAPLSNDIPRVQGRGFFGFGGSAATDSDILVMEAGRANGGLAWVRDHRKTFLAVTDVGYIRQILLARQASYRRSHSFGKPLLGEGLLTSGASDWQKRRRKVSSLFRFDMLDVLAPIVRQETSRTLDQWAELAESGQPLAVGEETRRLVIRTLTGAIFASTDGDERERLGEAIVDGLRQTHRRNGDAFHLPRAIPTPQNRRLSHTIHSIDGIIGRAIEERRASSGGQRRDLLDAMLAVRDPESGDRMDDEVILAEIKALLAGGIDTTASTLTRSLELLAAHREVGFSWYSEVDYQLHGRQPGRRDLTRLTRLTQIVNEVLRLFPPVPTISRECIVPDVLDGHEIAPGTRLQLSVLAVHRDELFWADPDEFRPGRFAREWPRHAHLPFGLGQHACVSSNFALVQLLSILAMIGQRFTIEAVAGGGERGRWGPLGSEGEPMLRMSPRG